MGLSGPPPPVPPALPVPPDPPVPATAQAPATQQPPPLPRPLGRPEPRRPAGGCLRRLVLGAFLIGAVGLGWWSNDDPGSPPDISQAEKSSVVDPSEMATAPTPSDDGAARSSRRMVRLDPGTVLRRAPTEDAASVHVTDADGLFEVQAHQGLWYQVRLPGALAATTDGSGWARLADGPHREIRLRSVWQSPRPSRSIDPQRLALAKEHLLGGGRMATCGAYPLLTDVEAGPLLEACDRLAASLDGVYEQRYGVRPQGRGSETIILFRQLDAFRRFVQAEGTSSAGYAGHASASGGYLVMYSGSQDAEEVMVTLVHELTHLVSWRALGGPLPRWLSEGLADGLGDSTTLQGIAPLRGQEGVEAEAQRLRQGTPTGLPGSEALLRLSPEAFDARPTDRHYEHSALLVRFLLLDGQLAPRFRAYLGRLAAGQPYDADPLLRQLGVEGSELDRRFARWLNGT